MAIWRVPAQIEYVGPGAPGLNVWNVRTVGPEGDEVDQLTEAVAQINAFYFAIKEVYPSSCSITTGSGIIKDPLGAPTYGPDLASTIVGSGGAELAPQLLAVVVSWRTSSASRSGRGRTFVGPLAKAAQDVDGTPSAAALATIRNGAQALVGASTATSGWAVGVLSTKQGVLRDVTGFAVRDQFAFLSSRRD
jgi:hypothetical protein